MDVSIIIVNYNTKNLTRNCINSIFEHTKDIQFEVLLSDNGSTDGSIEMLKNEFPEVKLILNNENLGFGKANNRALKIAQGKYILYLNSDTFLLNNAVKLFFDYWENSADKEVIGALGCNLLSKKMKIIFSAERRFPNSVGIIKTNIVTLCETYLQIFYKALPSIYSFTIKRLEGEVGYVCGADLFVKNDNNAKFDEKFFMYCEETDLQFKLMKQHKKRLIIDGPKIIHLEGASSNKTKLYPKSQIYASISRIIYLKNNFKPGFAILFLIKLITTLTWINPFIIKDTFLYLPKLWRT